MPETVLEVKVDATDKRVDSLATSVEHLVGAIDHTNKKIDDTNEKMGDIIEVISKHNILSERLANMHTETSEAFNRVYTEIRDVKLQQNNTGCSMLKVQSKEVEDLVTAVDEVRTDYFKFSHFKMVMSAVAFVMLTFGVYATSELHRLDNLATEKIHMQRGINKTQEATNTRFQKEFDISDKWHKEIGMPMYGRGVHEE